ncbi:hypothetical protein BDV12DRAFT_201328 [Aspergillus spectabilis]
MKEYGILADILRLRDGDGLTVGDLADMGRYLGTFYDQVVFVDWAKFGRHFMIMTIRIRNIRFEIRYRRIQIQMEAVKVWVKSNLNARTMANNDLAYVKLSELTGLVEPLSDMSSPGDFLILCPTGPRISNNQTLLERNRVIPEYANALLTHVILSVWLVYRSVYAVTIRLGPVGEFLLDGVYVLAMLSYLSLIIYVFAMVPVFTNSDRLAGEGERCNVEVAYVLFGVSVRAVDPPLRWTVVSGSEAVLLGVICSVGVGFARRVWWLSADGCDDEALDAVDDGNGWSGVLWFWGALLSGYVNLAVMLELAIARNGVEKGIYGQRWTFGQGFAMPMLVSPVIELVSVLAGEDGDG